MNVRYQERTEHLALSTRKKVTRNYNCGGYALGTYNWYCPIPKELDKKRSNFDFNFKDYFNVMVETILSDFKNEIRLLTSEKDKVEKDEYLIAFRCGCDDFHFMKKVNNKRWYHKMGWCKVQRVKEKEAVNTQSWGWRYDSQIAYFAKKVGV